MAEKTRLQKSLQLLRDLNTLRRRRDFDEMFVDGLLEDHDMEAGWIRLSTQEFQDMSDSTKMWAIHVQGPDTIVAQPDKATADARAEQWQKAIDAWIATRTPSPYDPTIRYVVIEYSGSYEHWRAEIDEHGGEPEDHC